MQFRHMRAFLAVVECGGLRAAARKLGLAQPAISRSVRQLEKELAVPLLQRSMRGTVPTEYGRALAVRLTIVEGELRRASDEIAQLRGSMGGHVAVGLSAASAFLMSSEALTRFWRAHPLATVRVVDGVFDLVQVELREGRVDFSIGPLPQGPLDQGVEVEALFENVLVPVVRRGHPLAKARSLEALQEHDWMLIGSNIKSDDLIVKIFANHGLPPPRITVTSESFPALLELVGGTDLITVLPLELLRHRFIKDLVTPIDIKEKLQSTVMAVAKRAGVPLTPLAESLAQEFRRLARRYR